MNFAWIWESELAIKLAELRLQGIEAKVLPLSKLIEDDDNFQWYWDNAYRLNVKDDKVYFGNAVLCEY